MKLKSNVLAVSVMLGLASTAFASDWPVYGGDTGNTRYSAAGQITPANVKDLKVQYAVQLGSTRSQESTPILIGDMLVVTSSTCSEMKFGSWRLTASSLRDWILFSRRSISSFTSSC